MGRKGNWPVDVRFTCETGSRRRVYVVKARSDGDAACSAVVAQADAECVRRCEQSGVSLLSRQVRVQRIVPDELRGVALSDPLPPRVWGSPGRGRRSKAGGVIP